MMDPVGVFENGFQYAALHSNEHHDDLLTCTFLARCALKNFKAARFKLSEESSKTVRHVFDDLMHLLEHLIVGRTPPFIKGNEQTRLLRTELNLCSTLSVFSKHLKKPVHTLILRTYGFMSMLVDADFMSPAYVKSCHVTQAMLRQRVPA